MKKKQRADRAKIARKRTNCCLTNPPRTPVQSTLDDGAAAIVGEEAQTAQSRLDAAHINPS